MVCMRRVVWVGDAMVTLVYDSFTIGLLAHSCRQFGETVVQLGVSAIQRAQL